MNAVREMCKDVGVAGACPVLAMPRASFYRLGKPAAAAEPKARETPRRAFTNEE